MPSQSNTTSGTIDQPMPPFPEQHRSNPGMEHELDPQPRYMADAYKPAGKLEGKAALITGGDSGIGRAVAVMFAREGADVAINYLPEEEMDASETRRSVEDAGRKCIMLPMDLRSPEACKELVEQTRQQLGRIDILVSNAAWQNRKNDVPEISDEEWDRTLKTNLYAYFWLAKAAIPHMPKGGSIIATSSIVGLDGSGGLIDYGATKGGINAMTKSLARNLADKGIRVNAVAPGPVWTPLNPSDSGLSKEKVAQFGGSVPMGRPGQPEELAPAYVFLASEPDSSYITGIVLEVTGGKTTAG